LGPGGIHGFPGFSARAVWARNGFGSIATFLGFPTWSVRARDKSFLTAPHPAQVVRRRLPQPFDNSGRPEEKQPPDEQNSVPCPKTLLLAGSASASQGGDRILLTHSRSDLKQDMRLTEGEASMSIKEPNPAPRVHLTPDQERMIITAAAGLPLAKQSLTRATIAALVPRHNV
jgi:hypothetical protein